MTASRNSSGMGGLLGMVTFPGDVAGIIIW